MVLKIVFWLEFQSRQKNIFIFFWLFFWCSNSYRLKDPLMSSLKALKQTTVFSDSSGTCISLHFYIFLQAFCHQSFFQEKRIIIINFKEVICSYFISLSLSWNHYFLFVTSNCCCGSNSKIEEHDIMQGNNSISGELLKVPSFSLFIFPNHDFNLFVWKKNSFSDNKTPTYLLCPLLACMATQSFPDSIWDVQNI